MQLLHNNGYSHILKFRKIFLYSVFPCFSLGTKHQRDILAETAVWREVAVDYHEQSKTVLEQLVG